MRTLDPVSLQAVEEDNLEIIDGLGNELERLESEVETPEEEIALFLERSRGMMLDVGCGIGRYARRFVEAGLDYVGVDISPNATKIAKRINPGIRFDTASFRKLPFGDETFDCLWSCCSLYYEPKCNIKNVLAELDRVLKPGGIILVLIPYCERSFEGICSPSGLYLSAYQPHEFERHLRSVGFGEIATRIDVRSRSMTFIAKK